MRCYAALCSALLCSFLCADVGRILFGWLPEERPVDGQGEPYGWAGAMSLPRLVVPYQVSACERGVRRVEGGNLSVCPLD